MAPIQIWKTLETRDGSATCPYCTSKIPGQFQVHTVGPSAKEGLHVVRNHCPACNRWSIHLVRGQLVEDDRQPARLGARAELVLL